MPNATPQAASSYRDAIVADHPVAYWRLDERSGARAADEMGHAPGQYAGGPALGVPGALEADPNRAVALDGADDGVNFGDPASGVLDFGAGSFTGEAWIRTTIAEDRTIISKEGSFSQPSWSLTVTDDEGYAGRLRLVLRIAGLASYLYGPAVRVDDGMWHYVAVSVDRSSGVTIVVDDASARGAAPTGDLSNAAPLWIGRAAYSGAFRGDVDEVALYAYAIGADHLAAHRAASWAGDTTPPAVAVRTPVEGSSTRDATPMMSGSSGAGSSDGRVVALSVWAGPSAAGAPLHTYAVARDRAGAWAFDPPQPLAPGTYTVQAGQVDAAGNAGRSSPRSFVIQRARVDRGTAPVVLAAGDIADCRTTGAAQTAAILDGQPGTVLPLGDTAYLTGSLDEFMRCYDPTWGRVRTRSRPTPGNHEYLTPGAAGFYTYFRAELAPFGATAVDGTRGWYSYTLGAWHVISLNSNCGAITGGCGLGSPQESWLRRDLAANTSRCVLAYWHEARYSSGRHASTASEAWWSDLFASHADVVLVGHDHDYERFAPQRADATTDVARGISQFVVGTGGASLIPFDPSSLAPNSQVRDSSVHGVLRLILKRSSFEWAFLPVAGGTFTDVGSRRCH